MSTKTNFSKKKEQKPVVRNARVRTHGLHIHDYTHKNPLKRHLTFPERTARTGAAARAPSGEHIHTSVVVYTRLNPTTFRTEGKLKKVASVSRGLLARVTHRRLDARRQNSTRASIDSFRRSWRRWLRKRLTSMSTGASCASRARAIEIEIARLHPDSRHRRSRSTDRWS